RTHQIRVHFLHLGFPLVGDSVYGKRQNKHLAEVLGYSAPRQMLHARKLVFRHPRTKQKRTFEATLPDDFKDALVALR
ncbi:MAG: RluA family pseudouridine synthase, partial [Verrucomicrobiota bacterium]